MLGILTRLTKVIEEFGGIGHCSPVDNLVEYVHKSREFPEILCYGNRIPQHLAVKSTYSRIMVDAEKVEKFAMISWFYNLSELNFEALMSVYEEGNKKNGAYLYPQESPSMQKLRAEQDFDDYLRQIFFRQKGAAYCVLTDEERYVSAVRIEPFGDGYLLSALETRPDSRRRGYARQLISELLCECASRGYMPIYSHVANRNIPSLNLHLQCGFSVYKDFSRYLDGTVSTNCKTLIYKK